MSATATNGNGYISRGNMTTILSATGLVMIAFGGFITFQNNATDRRISEVREDFKALQALALTKEEHKEFKEHVESDIARLEKGIVPRSEVEANGRTESAALLTLTSRVDELRRDLSAIATPQSQFIRMETDISELRKQLNETMLKKGGG